MNLESGLYYIETYGCQMNVHESEKIAGILEEMGYAETKEIRKANVIMFNTCCIRENAEDRARGNIGALKRHKQKNPDVIIGVCGCMTQQDGKAENLKDMFPFVDIILGTHNLHELSNYIELARKTNKNYSHIISEPLQNSCEGTIYRTSGVNAWVNIIYGCNNFCTYCIVPYVRGRERSRSIEDIKKEVEYLLKQGYKEITLLGQNVNSYNDASIGENGTFAKLLETLATLNYKYRLRFMTSHPKDFTDEVIDVIAKHDNICKYIHLPVQAGSNNVLKAMNRKYTREQYINLVKKIKEKIENVQISTDIMVGFPNETEENFLETLSLVEACRFTNAFMFIYSKRSGTVADKMEGQIPENIKSDRIARLIDLQTKISREIGKEFYTNKTFKVLVEDFCPKDKARMQGRTDCGRLVTFPVVESVKIGNFVDIKITSTAGAATLKGEAVCIN